MSKRFLLFLTLFLLSSLMVSAGENQQLPFSDSVCAGPQSREQACRELNTALLLLSAGAVDGAIDNARKALDDDAFIVQVTIDELTRRLEQEPSEREALGKIGLLYFAVRNYERSKTAFKRLINEEPDNPTPYFFIAAADWSISYGASRNSKKELGLEPWQRLPPERALELSEAMGPTVEEGIEMAKKALGIKPKFLGALAYLSLLYRERATMEANDAEREKWLETADKIAEEHEKVRREFNGSKPN